MRVRRRDTLLVMASSAGLALGVRAVFGSRVHVTVPARESGETAVQVRTLVQPGAAAAVIVARDPFRITRRPSSVAYDRTPLVPLPPSALPKPPLVLVGLVWDQGRDPTALVEGFPGVDGARPVRIGERIARWRVNAITSDRVVVSGPDTTWTLRVREPWR